MLRYAKSLLVLIWLLHAPAAFADLLAPPSASKVSNAEIVVARMESSGVFDRVDRRFRQVFIEVYFKPLEDRSVEIADAEAFAALIPDEVVAPYVASYKDATTEMIVMMFHEAHLARLAAIFEADEEATIGQIMSGALAEKYRIALLEAQSNTDGQTPDNSSVSELGEQAMRLQEFTAMIEQTRSNGGMGPLGSLDWTLSARLAVEMRNIRSTTVRRGNPVTLAAVEADGVLRFPNPVQRNSLIRELRGLSPERQISVPASSGGIRFIRPPSTSDASN